MRSCLSLLTLSLVFNLAACSSQQAYGVGQTWQRNQCFKIDDAQERSGCLESANTSFDQYRSQSPGAE
jgi:hypothetical protein